MASPTVSEFRTAFPEFADGVKYPDTLVQLWLDVSVRLVNADRWAELTNLGIMLATAHSVVIGARSAAAAAKGLPPGGVAGIQSSKSADGLSASYDVSSVTEQGAGQWNSTVYGTRYFQMLKLMGAGPLQSGVPSANEIGASGGAWPGVLNPYF